MVEFTREGIEYYLRTPQGEITFRDSRGNGSRINFTLEASMGEQVRFCFTEYSDGAVFPTIPPTNERDQKLLDDLLNIRPYIPEMETELENFYGRIMNIMAEFNLRIR